MKSSKETLIRTIRVRRHLLEISQRELADKLRMSQTSISNFEGGVHPLSSDALTNMVDALNKANSGSGFDPLEVKILLPLLKQWKEEKLAFNGLRRVIDNITSSNPDLLGEEKEIEELFLSLKSMSAKKFFKLLNFVHEEGAE